MEKRELIAETPAISVYQTDDAAVVLQSHKDAIFDRTTGRSETFPEKGMICNRMRAHFFRLLETQGIRTSFMEERNGRDSLMRASKSLPFALVVRNYSAGAFSERTGLKEGSALEVPTVEFRLDTERAPYQMVNGYDCLALKLVKETEIENLVKTAFHVNEILSSFFSKIQIDLVDCYMEFGRWKDELLLTGDLTPDGMRLWDSHTHEKMDSDRFRNRLGNVGDAYLEVYKRLGIGALPSL